MRLFEYGINENINIDYTLRIIGASDISSKYIEEVERDIDDIRLEKSVLYNKMIVQWIPRTKNMSGIIYLLYRFEFSELKIYGGPLYQLSRNRSYVLNTVKYLTIISCYDYNHNICDVFPNLEFLQLVITSRHDNINHITEYLNSEIISSRNIAISLTSAGVGTMRNASELIIDLLKNITNIKKLHIGCTLLNGIRYDDRLAVATRYLCDKTNKLTHVIIDIQRNCSLHDIYRSIKKIARSITLEHVIYRADYVTMIPTIRQYLKNYIANWGDDSADASSSMNFSELIKKNNERCGKLQTLKIIPINGL